MKRHDELIGMPVLVHPKLTYDPENRKNMIGNIISADLENDDIVVSFEAGPTGLFTADALLVLREQEEIQRDADLDRTSMPWWEYLEIEEIISLAGKHNANMHKTALRLARDSSPDTLMYTMESLYHAMELNKRQIRNR